MNTERGEIAGIQITPQKFEKILLEVCDAEIAAYPQRWTQENPLYSTCVPVSIVAQKIFGGKLLRANLNPFPEFKSMRYHWANLLPVGETRDFTRLQFGINYPGSMVFVEKPMSLVAKIPGAIFRSDLLYERLLRELS